MIKGTHRRQRNVRQRGRNNVPSTPNANILSATHGTNEVTIVFDSAVQIAPGIFPATWTFGAAPRNITGIVMNTSTTYVFSLNGSVATSDAYVIAPNDPAARTSGGGFVNGKTGTLA